MEIHQSAEDYLEKILMLRERLGYARSVDIAAEMNVTKPSVSIAMKRLRENGYIEFDKDNRITLTDKGRPIAERIYDRHKVLTKFFEDMGVSQKTAAEDACRIEHVISDESYAAVVRCVHRAL
ncbi:MAG: metal-dependent transcriptional regulator [Pyramidobacter sp.]|jgi:Mn-dependent DtxR family transcriptional regulator